MIFNEGKGSKQDENEKISNEIEQRDNQEDKPIHFKVEYDKNKNLINSLKDEKFNIENNNEKKNDINPEYFQENNKSNNSENNKYYNLLGENYSKSDKNNDNNINDYYYYYLNNNNNSVKTNEEDEFEVKKVTNFATQTYQGRIDPVKLNRKYKKFWEQHNFNNKKKYKQKYDSLKKVFQPYGYKTVINNFKKKGLSRSSSKLYINNLDRPSFDNTKQPLPKNSYLLVPFDFGINDPNYGKEEPTNYDRKKMAKIRMLKQPLKYYYPYTNYRFKNIKYE
jgi:hypothetical protein